MTNEVEFTCVDCGRTVFTWDQRNTYDRCVTCKWIVEHVPPEEQAAIRERLDVRLVRP